MCAAVGTTPRAFLSAPSIHPESSSGLLIGAEGSSVYQRGGDLGGAWFGGYCDLIGDLGVDALRFTVGPEIGYSVFGLDGGFAGQIADGRFASGLAVRTVITVGPLAVYGRWLHFPGMPEPDVGEVGILIKYVWGKPLRLFL
jgi:hypothetical protein